MPRVLIVEDDELIAKGMSTHLAEAGFDPLWMGNGEAGLARLRFERPDVCVLDLMMPLLDGWKLIETARAEGIGTPIVVVSARGDTTDDLIELAREISEQPPAREMDMLLSTGEQISIALMAMAIHELGEQAISFTGVQIGIRTDSTHTKARIR